MPAVIPIVMVAATAAGAAMQYQASQKQAATAKQVADYNAQLDRANAEQVAINAQSNIEKKRQDNEVYRSSQRAAYAASGILSGTGSPMSVLATTAGRQEQDIQQYWSETQNKETALYSEAQMGIYEGQQQADTYHLQGTAAIFQGIGSVANIAGGSAGRFNFGSGSSTTASSLSATPGQDFNPGGSSGIA